MNKWICLDSKAANPNVLDWHTPKLWPTCRYVHVLCTLLCEWWFLCCWYWTSCSTSCDALEDDCSHSVQPVRHCLSCGRQKALTTHKAWPQLLSVCYASPGETRSWQRNSWSSILKYTLLLEVLIQLSKNLLLPLWFWNTFAFTMQTVS